MRVSISIELERPRVARHRRRTAAAALLVAALLPVPALASHLFTDVPTAHTFHTAISRIKNAGITTGCSATTYCPSDPVTRGQMAGFLNRGLGRLGSTAEGANLNSSQSQVAGTILIEAAGVAGGYQWVLLIGTVDATVYDVGCPCQVELALKQNGAFVNSALIDVNAAGAEAAHENGTVMSTVLVPTGVTRTFTLEASG